MNIIPKYSLNAISYRINHKGKIIMNIDSVKLSKLPARLYNSIYPDRFKINRVYQFGNNGAIAQASYYETYQSTPFDNASHLIIMCTSIHPNKNCIIGKILLVIKTEDANPEYVAKFIKQLYTSGVEDGVGFTGQPSIVNNAYKNRYTHIPKLKDWVLSNDFFEYTDIVDGLTAKCRLTMHSAIQIN